MKTLQISLISLLFAYLTSRGQDKFNGNFEQIDKKGIPIGWDLTYNNHNTYSIKIDSAVKKGGRYAVSIASGQQPLLSNAITYKLQKTVSGKKLVLIGSIKTENVSDGFAGLWIRVDGKAEELAIETMENQHLEGTNDWKEYMVWVPYDETNATQIQFGALLSGKGKMWVDDLRFCVDDTPIDKAKAAVMRPSDDAYRQFSGIENISNTALNIQHLNLLGQIWGFLKYHHPAVAKGSYNWDAELFKVMPLVLKANTAEQFSSIMLKWLDQLGDVPPCKNCIVPVKNLAFKANYGMIFKGDVLSKALTERLKYIQDNAKISKNYYVSMEGGAGNPSIDHEKLYNDSEYPDAGIRLLALYRYWNIIQYFSPYRNLTAKDWNEVMLDFIPQLNAAKNKNEFTETLVKLVTTVKDSHGFISSRAYQQYLGKYKVPFTAKFIENELVVTGFIKDTLNVKSNVQVGDLISAIDGIPVKALVEQYLPVTSVSNLDGALRNMPETYLLRSSEPQFRLKILRDGQTIDVTQQGGELQKLEKSLYGGDAKSKPYQLLNNDIGYIRGNLFKRRNLDSIKKQFATTKGLIIDMRGYPIDDLIHTIGSYINSTPAPFVKFTKGDERYPGYFYYTQPTYNRGSGLKNSYKGKVIVIVNEVTQSNAEFVTMAFQTAANVKVIGSMSAGADGNITQVPLTGGFKTWYSGIGVYYPDGTETQQVGVKLDVVVKPTINGIKNGKDEVLEMAKALILEK